VHPLGGGLQQQQQQQQMLVVVVLCLVVVVVWCLVLVVVRSLLVRRHLVRVQQARRTSVSAGLLLVEEVVPTLRAYARGRDRRTGGGKMEKKRKGKMVCRC
jgi:threonine/homoserine/homoserine lactone efflux protein